MALIDSEASLKQRCQPIEGSDDLFESLKQNGVQSLRQLAFAIGSPQVPPTEEALKELTGRSMVAQRQFPPRWGRLQTFAC